MAYSQIELCDVGGAMRSLVLAHQHRCLPEHDLVDQVMLSPTEKWDLFMPRLNKIFCPKPSRRSLSMSSIDLSILGQVPSSRLVTNIADGEIDRTTQFMAPIHDDVLSQAFILSNFRH